MSDLLKDVSGGEWAAKYTLRIGDTFYVTDVFSANSYNVACVYGRTEEEATANAKLMAAAKDMAEALRDYLRENDKFDIDVTKLKAAQEKALVTLKKAGAA